MTTLIRTRRLRLLLVAVVTACSLAGVAAAQPNPSASSASTPAQTASPITTPTAQNASGPRSMDPSVVTLITLYVYLLVGFPFVLFGLNMVLAYVSAWGARKQLIDRLKTDALSDDQLKQLTSSITTGPSGIAGLTRSIIAFSLLLIVGVAVFHLMVASPLTDKLPESVDRILTLLTGALIAIIGFYFGSKASSEGLSTGTRKGADASSSGEEEPTGSLVLDPDRAKPAELVSITGGGFGANCGTITFGSSQARDQDIIAWTDKLIKVRVPAHARPGHLNVIVTKDDGHQIATPPAAFTVLD